MPRTPVKVKLRKWRPAFLPRFACRLPPRTPIISSGKTSVVTRRGRSRSSFIRSRCAIARTGPNSLIGAGDDRDVRLLERWLMHAYQRQGRVQCFQKLVGIPVLELDVEEWRLREGDPAGVEL